MTNRDGIVRHAAPDDSELMSLIEDDNPPPKGTWIAPEDMTADGGEPSLGNDLEEENVEDPSRSHMPLNEAVVNIPVSPLQFIQESIAKGLLDSLEIDHQTRAACFQIAQTLKPNATTDEQLNIAHWIWCEGITTYYEEKEQ